MVADVARQMTWARDRARAVLASRGALLGIRAVLHTSGTTVIAQMSMALAGVIAARALGADGKGVVVAVMAWLQLAVWLSLSGVHIAFSIRVSDRSDRSAPTDLPRVLGNAVAYATIVAGLASVVAGLVVPRLLANLGGETGRLVTWAMATIPVGAFGEMVNHINLGLGRTRTYNVSRLVQSGVLFGATTAFWLTGVLTPGLAIGAAIIGSVCAAVIGGWRMPWHTMRTDVRQLWSDVRLGFKTAIGGLVSFANVRLDLLVMSASLSAASVGVYGVANSVMIPVSVIAMSAATLLTPAVAKIGSTDGASLEPTAHQAAVVGSEARRYLGWSVAGGLLLAAAIPMLMPLVFGPSFDEAIALTWILIPGYVLRSYGSVLSAGAVGMRRPWVSNVSEGAGGLVTVLLLPLLLPLLGVVGAAMTSTISYGATAAAAYFGYRSIRRRATKRSLLPDVSKCTALAVADD